MSDFIYIDKGLFIHILPNNSQLEDVWGEFHKETGGIIMACHKKQVFAQFKKAGYTISKAKKVTKKEMANIFSELEVLGL